MPPLAALLALLAAPALPAAQEAGGFQALAEQVQERTLANGLRVLVLPRGSAPVASFHLHVAAGAIDEPVGLSGLAHFAEHMAFKGSRRIGARDWAAESAALAACDAAWARVEGARLEGAGADQVAAAEAAFEQARAAADAWSDLGAFDRALETAGGRDANASTGADATHYYVSLPVARMEQWFWLSREMLGDPVMREFYKERDVVMEERRTRTEANPAGAMLEALLHAAFVAHPYRNAAIGHMDDLRHLDRPEMIEFWRRHYTADRIVLAVVGRVDPAQVFTLAERYLGRLPAGSAPRPRRTAEPASPGPREVTLLRPSSPMLLAAWPTPPQTGRRGLLFEALGDLLAGGPTSRLARRLIHEQRAAVEVDWLSAYPGRIDPALFGLHVVPAAGRELRDCLDLAQQEVERLAAEGPTEAELAGLRRRAAMALLVRLADNAGLAEALATHEAEDGGWQRLFLSLEVVASLDGEDLRRAAASLRSTRRIVVFLRPAPLEG